MNKILHEEHYKDLLFCIITYRATVFLAMWGFVLGVINVIGLIVLISILIKYS